MTVGVFLVTLTDFTTFTELYFALPRYVMVADLVPLVNPETLIVTAPLETVPETDLPSTVTTTFPVASEGKPVTLNTASAPTLMLETETDIVGVILLTLNWTFFESAM